MSLVKIQIGASSGSLTTLDKALVNNPLDVGRQEQVKNKVTWHGHRNVAVLGQRKRVYQCTYENVTSSLYQTFATYALSSRKWWVKIPGYTGYNIFNGFGYVMFANEKVERVTDAEVYYAFTLLIFEL